MIEMIRISEAPLEWRQPKAFHRYYELMTDGQVTATLRFEKSCGTLATAGYGGHRWTFKRTDTSFDSQVRSPTDPGQSIATPEHRAAPVKLGKGGEFSIQKLCTKSDVLVLREPRETAGRKLIAHTGDRVQRAIELKTESALSPWKEKKEQKDNWQRLDDHLQSDAERPKQSAATRCAVKPNQTGGEQSADSAEIDPRGEVLRKEEAAQTKKPTEQHQHLKIPDRIRFEQLERQQDQKDSEPGFHASKSAIGKSDTANSDRK